MKTIASLENAICTKHINPCHDIISYPPYQPYLFAIIIEARLKRLSASKASSTYSELETINNLESLFMSLLSSIKFNFSTL